MINRLIVAIAILSLASFSFTPAFVKAENGGPMSSAGEDERSQQSRTPATISAAEPNSEAESTAKSEPNSPADSNATGAYDKMEKSLKDVDKASQNEIEEWIRESENKIGLARAVQQQVILELSFIREIAVEEKAVKTTEAIDRILASRKERFEKIIQKLEDERKKALESKQEERKGRTREPRRTRERSTRRSTTTE